MGKWEINLGGGFAGMLAVAFIVLKLIGEITWSWWWVLSPLWIPIATIISIIIVALLIRWLIMLIEWGFE